MQYNARLFGALEYVLYNAFQKKESSSLHSTVLTRFSKPSFVLKYYDFQVNSFKILFFITLRFF